MKPVSCTQSLAKEMDGKSLTKLCGRTNYFPMRITPIQFLRQKPALLILGLACSLAQALFEGVFVVTLKQILIPHAGGAISLGTLAVLLLCVTLRAFAQIVAGWSRVQAMAGYANALLQSQLKIISTKKNPWYRDPFLYQWRHALGEGRNQMLSAFESTWRLMGSGLHALALLGILLIRFPLPAVTALVLLTLVLVIANRRSHFSDVAFGELNQKRKESEINARRMIAFYPSAAASHLWQTLQAATERSYSKLTKAQGAIQWNESWQPAFLEWFYFLLIAGLALFFGTQMGGWGSALSAFALLLLLHAPLKELGRQWPRLRQGQIELDSFFDADGNAISKNHPDTEAKIANGFCLNSVSFYYSSQIKNNQEKTPAWIFKNYSGAFPGDQFTWLQGINGAGKSTLLRLLAHVESPQTGSIARPPANTLAYLPQEGGFRPDLISWLDTHDRRNEAWFQNWLDVTGVLSFLEKLKAQPNTIQEWEQLLSFGQRQRLRLFEIGARAAPILLLDEPFAGIPTQAAQRIAEHLFSKSTQSSPKHLFENHPWVGGVIAAHDPWLSEMIPNTMQMTQVNSLNPIMNTNAI